MKSQLCTPTLLGVCVWILQLFGVTTFVEGTRVVAIGEQEYDVDGCSNVHEAGGSVFGFSGADHSLCKMKISHGAPGDVYLLAQIHVLVLLVTEAVRFQDGAIAFRARQMYD